MRSFPNILIVGATHKDAGKTSFVCRLLSSFTTDTAPIAVKVTTIDAFNKGHYPILDAPYSLRREYIPNTESDSQRMVKGGARRVYWLRVYRDHLEEGVNALLAMLPSHHPVVCESNSIRSYIEPGAFVVLQAKKDKAPLPNKDRVLSLANYLIKVEDQEFSMAPEAIRFTQEHWQFPSTSPVLKSPLH